MVILNQEYGLHDDAESHEDFNLHRQYVLDDDLASFRPGSGSGSRSSDRLLPHETHLFEGTHNSGEEEGVADVRLLVGVRLDVRRVIARGSNDTVVYEGTFGDRKIAVKCIKKAHYVVGSEEIKLLTDSDDHQNVVSFYGTTHGRDSICILLGRCDFNLDDFINSNQYKELWGPNDYPSSGFLEFMKGIVVGLAHLHSLGIAHGNLKPQNVLIVKSGEGHLCAKLSGMCIRRRLVEDMSSSGPHATGSQGPQQIGHGQQTPARDLVGLGSVLFFCMTYGQHLFGDHPEQEYNVTKNKVNRLLRRIPEAVDLLTRLLDPNPELRPKASEVEHHPLFWESEKRMKFLMEASGFLKPKGSNVDYIVALKNKGPLVFNKKWGFKMDKALTSYCEKFRARGYNWSSVQDLVRIIRNNLHHYSEFPTDLQNLLGNSIDGIDHYYRYRIRFPNLLMEVYNVMHQYCKDEVWFRKYLYGRM